MSRSPNSKAVVVMATAFFFYIAGLAVLLRSVKFLPFGQTFPILTGDYALYFARALRTAAIHSSSHRYWGYDPFSMAGYPFNAVHETGSLFFSLLAAGSASLMAPGTALLILELASLALLPLPMFAFVRRLAGDTAACVSFALTVLMYGRFGIASVEPWLHGFLPFQIGCFLSLLQVGLLWQWIEDGGRTPYLGLLILSATIPMLHPGAAFFSLTGMVFALISFRNLLRRDHWRKLGLIAAVSLVVNWFWIRTFFAFRSWVVDTPYYEQMSLSQIWWHLIPSNHSFVTLVSVSFNFYAIVAATSGLLYLRRTSRSRFNTMCLWAGLVAIIGFAGTRLGISGAFGPGRYVLAFELMVYALAGTGIAQLLADRRGRITVGIMAAILVSAAVVSDVRAVRSDARKLTNTFPDDQAEVINFLKGPGRVDGRTLVECEGGDEPHFLDPLPLLTGAHVLGGTNVGNFLKARYTVFSGIDFSDGRPAPGYHPNVFGKRLEKFSPEEFDSLLRRYNVKQIIVWSVEAKVRLLLMTKTLKAGPEFGDHQVFWPVRTGGWLLEGKGDVSADYDHIRIAHASPGRLVLSYHWIDTLTVAAPASVKPVLLPGSPIEFIEVENPTGLADIDVFNAGL